MTICICSPTPVGLSSLANEVIALPLVYMLGSLYELSSRKPVSGCMWTTVIVIHNRWNFTSLLLVSSLLRGRVLDWRLSQPGFDPSYGNLVCLATLMSSDRTNQICLWVTIYIYIYIYIKLGYSVGGIMVTFVGKRHVNPCSRAGKGCVHFS